MEKTYKPYPTSKVLSDLHRDILLRLFHQTGKPEYFVWKTLDGDSIKLYDLRDSHLVNILDHISDNNMYRPLIEGEIKRRKINKLKKKTAGNILYGS